MVLPTAILILLPAMFSVSSYGMPAPSLKNVPDFPPKCPGSKSMESWNCLSAFRIRLFFDRPLFGSDRLWANRHFQSSLPQFHDKLHTLPSPKPQSPESYPVHPNCHEKDVLCSHSLRLHPATPGMYPKFLFSLEIHRAKPYTISIDPLKSIRFQFPIPLSVTNFSLFIPFVVVTSRLASQFSQNSFHLGHPFFRMSQ